MMKPVLEMRNEYLRTPAKQLFDRSSIFVIAIQGFIGSCTTEHYAILNDSFFSFVQIRGSVPVFWEQNGIQVPQKIEITRSPDAVLSPFLKHIEEVKARYGGIHAINLLSRKEGSGESILTEAFKLNVEKAEYKGVKIQYTSFDFHAVVKGGSNYDRAQSILEYIDSTLRNFGYLSVIEGKIVTSQKGVLRTNCLDCLDRTNVIQCIVSRRILQEIFEKFRLSSIMDGEEFNNSFNSLWADNGDWLSKIYAGTGAIKSSLTRKGKQTVLGFLDDAAKSVNRFYINNFQDKSRQEAIDALLGRSKSPAISLFDNSKRQEMETNLQSRAAEFSRKDSIYVLVGSWNVNGKLPLGDSTVPWLSLDGVPESPHIIALGIQELIELTAGQIVTADTDKLRSIWESHISRQIAQVFRDTNYVCLRSLNLVALGLFVFARTENVELIRNIDTAIVKTGLGGMAGNKGEKAVEERNRDYWTITNAMSFKGRKIGDHEHIFWFGDFNYRVNLPNDEVRQRIENKDWDYILHYDQLTEEKERGAIFQDLIEGRVAFAPTYKYDNGTTRYDTSEKARVPSWTDRILHNGKAKLLEYSRAECLISDHRPVRALYRANAIQVDELKKKVIIQQLREPMADQDTFVEQIIFEKSKTYKPPRPASGALLIDLDDVSSPF
ncbi:inositol polyphosphate 5-phosphatase, partial [Phlyctochytrium planicorne]